MTCGTCGETSEGRFCASCGSRMVSAVTAASQPHAEAASEPYAQGQPDTPAPTDATETQASDAVSATAATRPARGINRAWAQTDWPHRAVVAAALVALLVAFVNISANAGASAGDAAPVASNTAPRLSAHEICVNQVMASFANMHDNNADAAEVAVNGADDPFLDAAREVSGTFRDYQYVVGDKAAYQKAQALADRLCTDTLHDAQRPNYPTDGTYP